MKIDKNLVEKEVIVKIFLDKENGEFVATLNDNNNIYGTGTSSVQALVNLEVNLNIKSVIKENGVK